MADDNYTKDQTQQLVFNAEIKKDIGFIKDAIVQLQKTVSDYAQQFVSKADFVEAKTESDKTHADHEKRIRFIERYAWAAIGALWVVEIGVEVWKSIHG